MAEILIRRPSAWGDKLRSYRILVDGDHAGTQRTLECGPNAHPLLALVYIQLPEEPLPVAEGQRGARAAARRMKKGGGGYITAFNCSPRSLNLSAK